MIRRRTAPVSSILITVASCPGFSSLRRKVSYKHFSQQETKKTNPRKFDEN
jgi:hypothetical protein